MDQQERPAEAGTPQRDSLVFIQFGDFKADWQRLASGDPETYQAQNASMNHIVEQSRNHDVTIIPLGPAAPSDDMLDCGVRVIAPGTDAYGRNKVFWLDLLRPLRPTHAVLRTPCLPALKALTELGCDILATLADSFNDRSIRRRIDHWRLARALNAPNVRIVANHGRVATRQLAALGVKPAKVLAWDWPPTYRPHDHAPKHLRTGDHRPAILFVGMLMPSKGVDDLIQAIRILVDRHLAPIVRIVGKGDQQRLQDMIDGLALGDHVILEGIRSNREVFGMMRDADVVVVPSRHDYPEGVPLTIYEALASRTPLVLSDHPMFVGNLRDGQDGLIFPAGDAQAIAATIQGLLGDEAAYTRLSEGTAEAWERLQLPVTWMDLLDHWLADDSDSRAWLAAHSLAGQ